MSFIGKKFSSSSSSWHSPEVARAASPCESRVEVGSMQGRPTTGAGIHRGKSPAVEVPAVRPRVLTCDPLEKSESSTTASASECSVSSDADPPLSTASTAREPSPSPPSPIETTKSSSSANASRKGSRIKRGQSKDVMKRSASKESEPSGKGSKKGSHILVPPLPPLPNPASTHSDDEILRLKLLLAAKDRIIEDQQRKIDSYAIENMRSVTSVRPPSPASNSTPNVAMTSSTSSPIPLKRSDAVLSVADSPKPEMKKEKPSLRRSISDNAMKKLNITPRGTVRDKSSSTANAKDTALASSSPAVPPLQTSTSKSKDLRGGSMIMQRAPPSPVVQDRQVSQSPKKGSFISNLLTRRAESPSRGGSARGSNDGTVTPTGLRSASGSVSALPSPSGKVKSSTSGSSVTSARDAVPSASSISSQSAVEAELFALRAQVRLLQNMLMIEQENCHRRDGGATDRSAVSAASPHRRSGSFTAYNGEWVRLANNGAMLATSGDGGISASNSTSPLNRSRSSSTQSMFGAAGIFGQPLEIVLSMGIPKFFCRMTYHLESQGGGCQDLLTAIPDAARLATLKASINAGQDLDYQAMKTDASVVAALLRLFLRELPLPLLSVDTERSLLQATEVEDSSLRHSSLHVALNCDVAAYSRVLLQRLLAAFSHLHLLNMPHCSAEALAQFFGPAMFGYAFDLDAKNSTHSTMQQRAAVKALERLIESFPHMHARAQTMQFATSADEGVPRVKCASLRRAVELLFDPNYDDEEFVRVVVSMMHHFISPLGFAGELFTCYHAMVNCSPPKLWQQRIVDRMTRVFELWAKEAPLAPSLLPEFAKTVRFCNQSAVHPLPNELIDSLCMPRTDSLSPTDDVIVNVVTGQPISRTASLAAAPFPGVKLHIEQSDRAFKLLDCSADVVAEQMTLIEMELFAAIPAAEFLSKQLSVPAKAPRFHTYVKKFNDWSRWCATEILNAIPADTATRVSVLAKMIDLATICRRMNNFSTALALFSGMNMMCVSRLKHLFEKLPKKQARRYRKLDEFLSMDNNYRTLRTETKKAQLPAIPHMGLYAKTLATLEESSPTRIDPHSLINFEKLRAIYRVVDEVKRYQSVRFEFKVNYQIRSALKSPHLFNDDQLSIMSQNILPRDAPK